MSKYFYIVLFVEVTDFIMDLRRELALFGNNTIICTKQATLFLNLMNFDDLKNLPENSVCSKIFVALFC